MEVTKLTVSGENIKRLIDEVNNNYGWNYQKSIGNMTIFINEEFYFRIESNLTTTIVIDFIDAKTCSIDFISSGGGHGILGFSWGAEGKSIKNFIKLIKSLCVAHSWSYDIKE